MSRWKRKKKNWLIRHKNKRMRQLHRRKYNHYSLPKGKVKIVRKRKVPYVLEVPKFFSLSNNIDETVDFFDGVFDIIKKCEKGNTLFFNLSNVEKVTPDAIMYLIAVICNAKLLNALRIHCSGNMPTNNEARDVFEKAGFYNFVKANSRIEKAKDTERIRIIRGDGVNGETTSTICDFVNSKINSSSVLPTKRLFSMLIEMMANVKQHAYKDSSGTMIPRWYIYVENCEKEIRFIFLDSGVGIPNTIRKNWKERIKDFWGADKDDPTYIEAALLGEFRTETKQGFRGKGLPEIYAAVTDVNNRIGNMTIISGHGRCDVCRNNVIHKEYISDEFDGSLFMWNFVKGEDAQ